MRHQVALIALDGVVPFDLGAPTQIFGSARDDDDAHLYQVLTCSPGGRPVRASGGFSVLPDHGLDKTERADTVVVAGVHEGPALFEGTLDAEVAAALSAAYQRGARIMSICTGAFVLAAAGLLDGRPATTHWLHADRFRRLFPEVALDPDVLFIDDGQVLTSAGVGAGIDLCLHVVRRDHGSEVANRAARRSVVPPWREGGQAQYIERPLPRLAEASTAPTRVWALHRLGAGFVAVRGRCLGGDDVRARDRRLLGSRPVRALRGRLHSGVDDPAVARIALAVALGRVLSGRDRAAFRPGRGPVRLAHGVELSWSLAGCAALVSSPDLRRGSPHRPRRCAQRPAAWRSRPGSSGGPPSSADRPSGPHGPRSGSHLRWR